MYSLPKGPSKIVASARRGHTRPLDIEGYDNRDKASKLLKSTGGEVVVEMSNPKPTFQSKRMNRWKPLSPSNYDPALHENHIEMANLLSRQWKKVQDSIDKRKDGEFIYETYIEQESNKNIAGFKPFDLDTFWGGQTLKNALGKPPS